MGSECVPVAVQISSVLVDYLDWEEGKWAMVPGDSEEGTVTVVGDAQPGSEWLQAKAGPVPHPIE